jgi:transposase
MRQTHRAGEKMFVDFAGETVPIVDPGSGEIEHAYVYVAVLGASNYTYAEATMAQDLESWVALTRNALEFLEGSAEIWVPDNLKAGVSRTCRDEPDTNPTYSEMAEYYGAVVIPARPRKPRDKATVNIDHHITVDHNLYSVPHSLIGHEPDVRLTARTVEVSGRGHRVAVHQRAFGRGRVTI